jgi:membrane protein required for colicin V production
MDWINPFDAGIAVIVGFCVIRGFFRGFIREVFSLIGLAAGFYGACIYYRDVAEAMSRWIPRFPYTQISGFILIFIGAYIAVALLGIGIKYLLGIVFLAWVDRFCGVIFGAVKGILIVSILLLVSAKFLPGLAPMMQSSRLAPKVAAISEKIVGGVPMELKRQFAEKMENLKKAWKNRK